MIFYLDWPDYSSSGSQSDEDHIPGTTTDQSFSGVSTSDQLPTIDTEGKANETSSQAQSTSESPIPTEDLTAQRIMHLLNEIGTSNLVERMMYDERHFLHCNRCLGRLIMLWAACICCRLISSIFQCWTLLLDADSNCWRGFQFSSTKVWLFILVSGLLGSSLIGSLIFTGIYILVM